MKKQNLLLKFLVGFVVLTVLFFVGALYSVNRAMQADPLLPTRIQQTLEKAFPKGNFNVSISGVSDSDFVSASSVWKFSNKTQEIEIRSVSASIEIIQNHDDEDIVVKARGRKNKTWQTGLLETSFNDEKLLLKELDDDQTRAVEITVSVPPSYKNRLIIKTVSGDVKIEAGELSKISTETVSGEISVGGNRLTSLDLTTVSGDVKADFMNAEKQFNFQLKTISGEITQNLSSNAKGKLPVLIKSVSGDILIQEVATFR